MHSFSEGETKYRFDVPFQQAPKAIRQELWLGWLADRIGPHNATAVTGGLAGPGRDMALVEGDLRVERRLPEFPCPGSDSVNDRIWCN